MHIYVNKCLWFVHDCSCLCTCLSSLQTGLVKGVELRQLSLFMVTAGISVLPWGLLGAVVPWRGLATVAVVLWPDGNTAVRGRVIWCDHSVRAVQTPWGPMTYVAFGVGAVPRPVWSGASRWMGLRRLPHRRERFPLPRGLQRGRGGRRSGRRGRVCVWGFKVCGVCSVCSVCGVCIPETQRKRGQWDG